MKVYIMPCGWDRELVTKTAFKRGADKLCLISAALKKNHTYTKTDTITQSVNESIKKALSSFLIIETIEVNYIDFNDIVNKVSEYIANHKDDEIIINISTGSHMVTAALIFTAYLNNVKIEYSIAENHNPKVMSIIEQGGDYHHGFTQILDLPLIPVSITLSQKERAFMSLLKEHRSLSVHTFIEGSKGNDENRKRSEFNYLCKKLEKNGLIKTTHKHHKLKAELTQMGELFLKRKLAK